MALAASLRANSALRTLNLGRTRTHFGIAHLFLGALAGDGGERPSRCGLTSLDLSACQLDPYAWDALGKSLSRGAPLEELKMVRMPHGYEVGHAQAAVAIADGIRAAGGASCLRRLRLSSTVILTEGEWSQAGRSTAQHSAAQRGMPVAAAGSRRLVCLSAAESPGPL